MFIIINSSNMLKLLLAISLTIAMVASQNWEEHTQDGDQPIAVIQHIPNQIVEEYETLQIDMGDHFSCSLLRYKLDIQEISHSSDRSQVELESTMALASETIQMNKVIQSHAFRFLPGSDLQAGSEPFPRSTITLDNQFGLLKMYMINRNFSYISYCYEGYLKNLINQRQIQQLNTSIVNGTCTDLKHVAMNDTDQFLFALCLSSYYNDTTPDDDSMNSERDIVNTLTIVQIRNYDLEVSDIYYYSQDYNKLRINTNTPFRFVGNFSQCELQDAPKKNGSFGLFLANILDEGENPQEHPMIPSFIWVDFTIFQDMRKNNETYRYDPFARRVFKSVDLLLPDHSANDVRVVDYKTIFKREGEEPVKDSDSITLAIVVEAQGMLLCRISNYKLIISNAMPISCDQSNSFFYIDNSAVSVHYEPDHPDNRVYLVSAIPPKVTELDISDLVNYNIAKIYFAQEVNTRRYVGQGHIAVNNHLVMHLMRDLYSNQYVIRTYCRHGTFFNIALSDIMLPPMSRSGFISFPNYYFDKFLYRDERTANISEISMHRLVVNRTEKALTLPGANLLNNKQFNVSLHTGDRKYLSSFTVTFVDRKNTTVFQKGEIGSGPAKVVYSCGDSNFSYDMTKLFNGPDFKLSMINHPQNLSALALPYEKVSEGEQYFRLSNSQEIIVLNSTKIGDECKRNIIVPAMNGQIVQMDRMLMICINLASASFISYNINITDDPPVGELSQVQNNITLPFSRILEYQYDPYERVLFALVANTQNSSEYFLSSQIEVHYFHFEGCLSWKAKHPIEANDFTFVPKENLMGYSSTYNKGVFIWNSVMPGSNFTNVTMLLFKLNFINYTMYDLVYHSFNSFEGSIVKAVISNQNMLYALTNLSKILVLQVFPSLIKIVNTMSCGNASRTIIDFDYVEDMYLVVYHNDSVTEVYSSEKSFDINHKMRLPKYEYFENYTYKTYVDNTLPKRDTFEKTIVLLLENQATQESAFLIYKLDEPQHNALYVANTSFGNFFSRTEYSWIILTGDNDDATKHYLGMTSDKGFLFVELRYYDNIKINKVVSSQLIAMCKDVVQNDWDIMVGGLRRTKVLSQIQILPNSDLFTQEMHHSVSIDVSTANYGLALIEQPKAVSTIMYCEGRLLQTKQVVMVESFVQGYNMNFTAACSYKDSHGIMQSCTQGLTQNLTIAKFQFPLDFVTSERWVHQSYPLGKYFFILDSWDSIFIMRLPAGYEKEYLMNDIRPLEKATRLFQSVEFGCTMHDQSYFGKMIKVNQTDYLDRDIYLFFYQCYMSDKIRRLSAIEISVFTNIDCDETTNNRSCIEMKQFGMPEKLVYDVVDLALVNLTYTSDWNASNVTTSALSYRAKAAVVCNIDLSFSNILLVYNMHLNGSSQGNATNKVFQNMTLEKWNSATKLNWDTFKVNHVVAIPDSMFLVASLQNYGAIFYHTGKNEIIACMNISEYDDPEFWMQTKEQYGQLKVFGVDINLPYAIYVFSNYGVFVLGFNVSLQDEHFFMQPENKGIKPYLQRTIRFPFQIDEASIVASPYGIAMLVKAPTGRRTFAVKLIAITHYTGIQSKLFRSLDILQNQNCTTFNRNRNIEYAVQDQLGVSFICDSRLRIVRFCMRPNIEIDLSEYFENATGLVLGEDEPGVFQFNDFYLNITATNEYSTHTVNNVTVPVHLMFQQYPSKRTDILTLGIVVATVVTGMILFLFLRSRHEKYSNMMEKGGDMWSRRASTPNASVYVNRSTVQHKRVLKSGPQQEIIYTDPSSLSRGEALLMNTDIQTALGEDDETMTASEVPSTFNYLNSNDQTLQNQHLNLQEQLTEQLYEKQRRSSHFGGEDLGSDATFGPQNDKRGSGRGDSS